MPITPLHFGVLAPINHFFPGKVSITSFVLANLLIDANAIMYWMFNLPLPEHTWMPHSFLGVLPIAIGLSVLGLRSWPWIWGAVLGSISHIILDMLVHAEMLPLYPKPTNPFYLGWMEPVSMALLPLTIWLIAQIVSSTLGWVRRRQEPVSVRTP